MAQVAHAEPYRIATYHPELERTGPGLLLRDILSGDDPQVLAVSRVIAHVAPDVLLLTSFDYDHGLVALRAFADGLKVLGIDYPYVYAAAPNSGVATGLDMDGDGWLGDASDAQGFGAFAGQGGLAVLSRFPVLADQARDFSRLKWVDFPGAIVPAGAGNSVQRLSSTAHWDVPVSLPDGGVLHLMAFHAGTPAFDGADGRNAARNRDEVRFWQAYLDGALPLRPADAPFVILGDANLDPADGQGHRSAIRTLLADPRLQDPRPRSQGGAEAATLQRGVNDVHSGDPALDTADWPDVDGPGNLRVDYVLPSAALQISDAGVFWPASDDPNRAVSGEGDGLASRHALVWVDVLR